MILWRVTARYRMLGTVVLYSYMIGVPLNEYEESLSKSWLMAAFGHAKKSRGLCKCELRLGGERH